MVGKCDVVHIMDFNVALRGFLVSVTGISPFCPVAHLSIMVCFSWLWTYTNVWLFGLSFAFAWTCSHLLPLSFIELGHILILLVKYSAGRNFISNPPPTPACLEIAVPYIPRRQFYWERMCAAGLCTCTDRALRSARCPGPGRARRHTYTLGVSRLSTQTSQDSIVIGLL